MDDALPVWPLGHWVVGKALADGVGWVHGGRPFPLWDWVGGRGSWLSDLHLGTCVRKRNRLLRDSGRLKPSRRQISSLINHPVLPHNTAIRSKGKSSGKNCTLQ